MATKRVVKKATAEKEVDAVVPESKICPDCNGRGLLDENTICPTCSGSGKA